jgi:integrase
MAPLLLDLLEREFLPSCCADASDAYRTRFRVAVRWLGETVGHPPRTSDLTCESLDLFVATLASAGYSRRRIWSLRQALAALWRFADRLAMAPPYAESRMPPLRSLGLPDASLSDPFHNETSGRRIVLPKPFEGTLRAYFDAVYRPQRLQVVEENTLNSYRNIFLTFWRWLGRDLTLDDCSNERAAAFVSWMLETNRSPVSINRCLAHWRAIWNHAHNAGLVPAAPTIKTLPINRKPPDAWSMVELSRLVASAATFRPGKSINGISYGLLFRALVIVGFHTAARKRSLLSIARRDVDLDVGRVSVRACNVKTRRGRRYELPPYAIESLRAIWEPNRELLFPIRPGWAGLVFKQLVKHAGLGVSEHHLAFFHKLRRSAATQATAMGGMRAASELLDHSTKYLTERYVDPTEIPANGVSGRLPAIAGVGTELAEARELLAAGRPHLAAMAARIILERNISARCRRLREKRPPGVAAAAKLLALRGLLTLAECRLLCRAARTANHAAHGRPVDAADVAQLIQVVAQFAGDGPEEPFAKKVVS